MISLDSSGKYMPLPNWCMFFSQRCKAEDSMELAILFISKCWSLDFPYINNHFHTSNNLFVNQRCTVNSKIQEFLSGNIENMQESRQFRSKLPIFLIFLCHLCQCTKYICVKVFFLFQVNLHAPLISLQVINSSLFVIS